MSKIAIVFFPSNAYIYEDEVFNQEARDNPTGILRNDVSVSMRQTRGKLKKECQEMLDQIVDMIKCVSNEIDIKIKYSPYAGCSICPCSPGYIITGNIIKDRNQKRKKAFYVDEKGQITNIINYN